MKKLYRASQFRQTGAASILIAAVLSMTITLVTLSVAKTRLIEQRISGNNHLHTRLSLESQSRWADAVTDLNENFEAMTWLPAANSQDLIYIRSFTSSDGDIKSAVRLSRPRKNSRFVDLESISSPVSGTGMSANFHQEVRLLTLLSPVAELSLPLIINGCITQTSNGTSIKPINSDTDTAGVAVRLAGSRPCPPFPAIDLHGGSIITKHLRRSLWLTVFTVSIEEFMKMVKSEQAQPGIEQRYRVADSTDLVNGRWTQSMGRPDRPVALYFPPQVGCPEFSPGVRIYGVVFIDSSCQTPIASMRLEIFGSLIINGDFNAGGTGLQLNHIQAADKHQTLLDFPVLRSLKIPGSWRDF